MQGGCWGVATSSSVKMSPKIDCAGVHTERGKGYLGCDFDDEMDVEAWAGQGSDAARG